MLFLEEQNGFSPDHTGAAALATVAATAGNAFKIRERDGWVEPAMLWMACVGPSSAKKSPAISRMIDPLAEFDRTEFRQYRSALAEYEQRDDKKGARPRPKHYIIQNSTMESVFYEHAYNRNGLMLYMDEIVGWVNSMNQYRKGADTEIWLQVLSNKMVKVTRATKEPIFIDNGCITVLGGIQPGVLQKLAADGGQDNGFIYRILFAYPDRAPVQEYRDMVKTGPEAVEWEQCIQRIMYWVVSQQDGYSIVDMSPEARDLWREYYNQSGKIKASLPADRHEEDSLLGKIDGYVLRLALVLHLMHNAYDSGYNAAPLSGECMAGALRLAAYFRGTFARVRMDITVTGDDRVVEAARLMREGMKAVEVAAELGVQKYQITRWAKKNPDLFK